MCSRLVVMGTVSVMLTACSGDKSSLPFVVRDSVGIEIVESYRATWGVSEGWMVSEEPVVKIGMEERPEEYSLYRVVAALRLPSGNILIANAGTDQLRYYDSASGEYGRTLMLHREAGTTRIEVVGVFSDGTMLSREAIYDGENASETDLYFARMFAVYRRHSREGDVLDSLGFFLWRESIFETVSSRTDAKTGIGYMTLAGSLAPFGSYGSAFAHGEYLYHGTGDT